MPIYSRDGDGGDTDGLGGERARKAGPYCEAVGTCDELAAHVGNCLRLARETRAPFADDLEAILSDLHRLMADLASAGSGRSGAMPISQADEKRLEQFIDGVWRELGSLNDFIQPTGSEFACALHMARTVCRRAERRIVAYLDSGAAVPEAVVQYANRLGDALFAMARREIEYRI